VDEESRGAAGDVRWDLAPCFSFLVEAPVAWPATRSGPVCCASRARS